MNYIIFYYGDNLWMIDKREIENLKSIKIIKEMYLSNEIYQGIQEGLENLVKKGVLRKEGEDIVPVNVLSPNLANGETIKWFWRDSLNIELKRSQEELRGVLIERLGLKKFEKWIDSLC